MENQKVSTKRIMDALNRSLVYQFDKNTASYSWEDMINDTEGLTDEEKRWAKKNTGCKACVLP